MNEKVEDRTQQAAPVDPVFPRFFRDGEEPRHKLVGLMAYGLYEEARREWVDDFKGREGRYPTSDELRAYETSWTASRLDGLKNAAVQVLASYADSLAREVENQALRRALRGGFFRSVARWLFSAILFAAAVLGAMVALSRAGVDVIDTLQGLLRPASPVASAPPLASNPAESEPPLADPPGAPAARATTPPAPSPEPQVTPPPRPAPPVTPAPRSGR
jgi:hypothetical protein